MKIYCTVREFGLLVRACEKAQCYNCALKDICKNDSENMCKVENFIEADTIEKEGQE